MAPVVCFPGEKHSGNSRGLPRRLGLPREGRARGMTERPASYENLPGLSRAVGVYQRAPPAESEDAGRPRLTDCPERYSRESPLRLGFRADSLAAGPVSRDLRTVVPAAHSHQQPGCSRQTGSGTERLHCTWRVDLISSQIRWNSCRAWIYSGGTGLNACPEILVPIPRLVPVFQDCHMRLG